MTRFQLTEKGLFWVRDASKDVAFRSCKAPWISPFVRCTHTLSLSLSISSAGSQKMHVQNIYSTCYLFSESCLHAFAVHFSDCSGVISIISLQNLVTLEEEKKPSWVKLGGSHLLASGSRSSQMVQANDASCLPRSSTGRGRHQ